MKSWSGFTVVGIGALVVAAVSLAHAAAVDPDTAASELAAAHAQQMQGLEAGMKRMQQQIERLRQTKDPAQRQRLLAEHLMAMREQMSGMRALGGPTLRGQPGMGPGSGGGKGKGDGMGRGMANGTGMGAGMGMAVPPASPPGAAKVGGPGLRHSMTVDRLDMMQMMMEQMLEQMQLQAQPSQPAPVAAPPGAATK